MNEFFAPVHVMILLLVAGVVLLPWIFYILTLQRILKKCAPESRAMSPEIIWLYLVPVANIVISFLVAFKMAETLRKEFNRRGIFVADPNPGQTIGLAMAITMCCSIIPFVGILAGLASLVLWAIYWAKIADYSRLLDAPPQMPSANVF